MLPVPLQSVPRVQVLPKHGLNSKTRADNESCVEGSLRSLASLIVNSNPHPDPPAPRDVDAVPVCRHAAKGETHRRGLLYPGPLLAGGREGVALPPVT